MIMMILIHPTESCYDDDYDDHHDDDDDDCHDYPLVI